MVLLVGPLNTVVDFLARNPLFVVVLVGLLGFLFFMYLLVRRTVLGLREGYEEGQRGR